MDGEKYNNDSLHSALETFMLWEKRETQLRDPGANYRLLAIRVAMALIHEKLREVKNDSQSE